MPVYSPDAPIALCGFMASGKTTLGLLLAQRLHFAFVDTDDMVANSTQMTIPQLFAAGGESFFRDAEHQAVCAAAQMRRTVISTGGGVMTFERNALILAQHAEIIHISRSFDSCYAAILRRKNRPIAGQKSREELRALYDARCAAYHRYASLILPNDSTPEEALQKLLLHLQARIPSASPP